MKNDQDSFSFQFDYDYLLYVLLQAMTWKLKLSDISAEKTHIVI